MATEIRDRVTGFRRIPAKQLRPHPSNWRRHPEAQRQALKELFADIGFAGALVVYEPEDGKGPMILDGHLRQEERPDAKLPCVIVDLTDKEAAELLTFYDPIGSLATQDTVALEYLSTQFKTEGEALAAMLKEMLPAKPNPEADRIPQEVPSVAAEGDLWLLGDHRLVVGDATDAKQVERATGGTTPNLLVTDPPYGVNYDAEWRDKAAEEGHLAFAAMRTGKVQNDDVVDWSAALGNVAAPVAYVFSAGGDLLIRAGLAVEAAGYQIRSGLVWKKPHFPISRGAYTYQHEPIWYGVRKGSKAHWIGPKNASSVWEAPLDQNVPGGHSTQKPVEVFARPMRHHGKRGWLVADPFLGSGTALIAAEETERVCCGLEIDTHYADVCIERWQQFTGGKARKG